jgi:molybdopterin molybdotransferase
MDDPPSFHDPRMRGFRARTTVEEVIASIDARVHSGGAETVNLNCAGGRVLAQTIEAEFAVPPFDRSAMDGYAVRGEETFGADSYTPAMFRIVGSSRPGRGFIGAVSSGEAVEITTGAPLPEGTDAVVPAEAAVRQGTALGVVEPTPPQRHVGRRGEDIQPGTTVLSARRVLRPQDLGVLSALGISSVSVVRNPSVTVVITGDELLPAGSTPRNYQIPDMNSVMLSELIIRDGGRPLIVGPLADDRDLLAAELKDLSEHTSAIMISGGSSTGPEDYAPGIVAELGEIVAHGIALRPASPTGWGFIGDVPVVLLPGNPVSCLCAYDFFGGRIVRRLAGRPPEWPYRAIERPLSSKLVSSLGRVDYARVRLDQDMVEPLAISGASILSSTTRADGFVVVPADREGYPEGAIVTVWLYDLHATASASS